MVATLSLILSDHLFIFSSDSRPHRDLGCETYKDIWLSTSGRLVHCVTLRD